MNKTFLIAIIILTYLFVTSCEDAVNSDDNVYVQPEGEYTIVYSVSNGKTSEYDIYTTNISNTEKKLWKQDATIYHGAVDNKLLVVESNLLTPGFFKYNIYDFTNNTNTDLFGNQETTFYARLINENKLITCDEFVQYDGNCSVMDLTNNSQISFSDHSLLAGVFPSPDGNKLAFVETDSPLDKYYTINSNGTDKKEFALGSYGVPSCWTPDSKEIIAWMSWMVNEQEPELESRLIKVNPETNKIDTLRKFEKAVSWPSVSPDGKKVAFYLYPDGLGIMNIDGSDFKVFREPNEYDPVNLAICINEWSPDNRYILYKRLYSEESGDTILGGLEMVDTKTGSFITIEEEHIVMSATWVIKK